MAILNNTFPNLLTVQYKYLLWKPNTSRDDLIDICAPSEIVKTRVNFTNTLNVAKQLGLLIEENKKLCVNPNLPKEILNKKYGFTHLPKIMCELIMNDMDGDSMWKQQINNKTEDPGGRDFVRLLSWMLAQQIKDIPQNGNSAETLRTKQSIDPTYAEQIYQNHTRWNPFCSWSRFLGFGNGSNRFISDPTIAITHCLPAKGTLGLVDFVDQINTKLPVLDGGKCRLAMEDKLKPSVWNKFEERHLSPSLSLALNRLEALKKVVLRDESDADNTLHLTTIDGNQSSKFSHIDII